MIRKIGLLVLFIIAAAVAMTRLLGRPATPWVRIAPNLEMRMLSMDGGGLSGRIRVIALRTSAGHLHIVTGAMLEAPAWRSRARADAAVNGGFFDPTGQSVGLRVSDGHVAVRQRPGSGGVFYIRNGAAHIVSTADFAAWDRTPRGIRDAVQCGPLLVAGRRLNRLKPQENRRTGIGIQPDGRVVIAIADGQAPLPAWAGEWASPQALDCRDALNLDGGPSTQLSLHVPGRSVEVPGGWPVPDAVVIR